MECGIIEIKYFGYLAEIAGRDSEKIRVCGEKRIRDLIRLEGIDLNDLVILVNGVGKRPGATVKPGDKITILPHISGGSQAQPRTL